MSTHILPPLNTAKPALSVRPWVFNVSACSLRWLRTRVLPTVAMVLALAGCGGGGGDAPITELPVSNQEFTGRGPNIFALFPNPLLDLASIDATDPTKCADLQVLDSCRLQTNEEAYAAAYYAAIDPANDKNTLAKWKTANGFDNGATNLGPLGQVEATLGDAHDLGFGRRMTGRQNANGTIAFYVENYNVDVGTGYGDIQLNVEAAARQDPHWFIGTNAIEFSPGPVGTLPFAKFYTFNPVTGARLNMVNLDARGEKAMPGLCVQCHGGRGDPLTPTGLFARSENTRASLENLSLRGDVAAKLQPFKVDEFKFFNAVVNGVDYSRAGQEAKFKAFNQMVLCTYPKPVTDTSSDFTGSAPCTRPAAGLHDWQGKLAEVIKAAYGGDGMPNATYSDTFVPNSWSLAGKESLFYTVVKPYCATCHAVRGGAHQSDIDFLDYAAFAQYAPYIKKHVFQRGNMPLARLTYQNFWADPVAPKALADWLLSDASLAVARDAGGKPIKPGAPVADPGPNRVVPPNTAVTLSALQSQFASSFTWAFTSNPVSAATLDGGATSTSANPVFSASADGSYTVTLTAKNTDGQSSPGTDLTIVVKTGIADPASLRFSDASTILQNQCAGCHQPGANPLPPVYYLIGYDRSATGDGTSNTNWLYAEVKGQINFTDLEASPLLRKPAGYHHGDSAIGGFNVTQDPVPPRLVGDPRPPGDPLRVDYDTILNWMLSGAPQ